MGFSESIESFYYRRLTDFNKPGRWPRLLAAFMPTITIVSLSACQIATPNANQTISLPTPIPPRPTTTPRVSSPPRINTPAATTTATPSPSATSSAATIRTRLERIGTRIVSGQKTIGSGTLFQRRITTAGNTRSFVYIVVTNAHVVDNITNYQVSTFDGRIHATRRLQNPQITNRDLAILIFKSSIEYQPATIGNSQRLKSGDPVYAGGFPAQPCPTPPSNSADKNRIFPCAYNFNLSEGLIFQRLNKELAGGYQIGYTNDIKKGMSGGPLIDRHGNLVAINGVHSSPLWAGGWTYADGSPVAEPLQSTLDRYSWGIPIERIPPNF